MIFKNKTSQAVSNQSTAEWLADYDRAAKKPLHERNRPPQTQKAPKPPPVPLPGLKQHTADWLADHERAKNQQRDDCLDTYNRLNTQYLPETCLIKGGSKIVKSQHGTGKSTVVRAAIEQFTGGKIQSQRPARIVIVCAGVQQALSEHAKNPGFEYYGKAAHGEIVADRVIIVIDSIHRIRGKIDLLILDESEQIAASPLKANLHAAKANPYGRQHLYNHLVNLIGKAGKVLFLDADAGPLTEALTMHSLIDVLHIENEFKSLGDANVTFTKSRGSFLQQYHDHAENTHLFCGSSKDARTQARRKMRVSTVTLITRDTGQTKKQDFIRQVSTGQHFSGDLITTTAVRSAVSIDAGTHDIKTVFAWIKCGPGYPPLTDQVQAMRRCRGVTNFVIYIDTGSLKTPLTTDPMVIREELERSRAANAKHVQQFIVSDPLEGVRLGGVLTDIHCLHQAELNRQRNEPALWMREAFEQLGATVVIDDSKHKMLDKIQTKKNKKAKDEVIDADLLQCDQLAIPENIDQCTTKIEKALFTAKHVLDYGEDLAREAAKRDVEKAGFVKSIQRRQHETRPQSDLAREDAELLAAGDPVARYKAKAAAMKKEVLNLCSDLLQGEFSKADTDPVLMPWIIRNVSAFGEVTGTKYICPEEVKSAGFLKRILEGYGITVTARKSNGQRVYFVDRTDELNQRALEQLTGTSFLKIVVINTETCPSIKVAA